MKVIPETFMCTKFDIYVSITSFQQCIYLNVFFEPVLYDRYKMYVKFPGKLVTCISYENYVYRTKSD